MSSKAQREARFRAVAEEGSRPDRHFVFVPIKESDVPPGSVLSEQTLALIHDGGMTLPLGRAGVFPETVPVQARRRMTYQDKLKARWRAKHPDGATARRQRRRQVFDEARRRVDEALGLADL